MVVLGEAANSARPGELCGLRPGKAAGRVEARARGGKGSKPSWGDVDGGELDEPLEPLDGAAAAISALTTLPVDLGCVDVNGSVKKAW